MPRLIIGCGNEFRGDDAAGLVIARHIRELNLPEMVVLECPGEGTMLITMWDGFDDVTLVDAASGMEVGEIMEWNARREPLPSSWNMTSSHYVGIAEAIELSRSLGRLPAQLKVLAIGGGQFDVGNPLSTEVQRAIKLVVNRLQEYALN